MAEGFAKKMLPLNVKVFSAGTNPEGLHPLAEKVMHEIGIDISNQTSKSISEVPIDEIDIVITLCGSAREQCPVFPEKVQKYHWPIEDPQRASGTEKEVLEVFRKVRDKIREYMFAFAVKILNIKLNSIIRCPECGFEKDEIMPLDSCVYFYKCENCQKVLRPAQGDCCVYCSYGNVKCPPRQ